jgi:hypothetical protein
MKLSVSRSMMLLALALGLSACGSKATFEVKGTVNGLQYEGLVLTDSVSGARLAVHAHDTTFKFPNTIEYGTEYKVVLKPTDPATDQPAHQNCTISYGSDTAGRLASINIIVNCTVNTANLTGTIKVTGTGTAAAGLPTGLKLINGSDASAFVATATSVDYSFAAIPFDQAFGLSIASQPADLKTTCVLVPTAPLVTNTPDQLSVSGKMGDSNAIVNVACTTVP